MELEKTERKLDKEFKNFLEREEERLKKENEIRDKKIMELEKTERKLDIEIAAKKAIYKNIRRHVEKTEHKVDRAIATKKTMYKSITRGKKR